jgi:hypothetical protein
MGQHSSEEKIGQLVSIPAEKRRLEALIERPEKKALAM